MLCYTRQIANVCVIIISTHPPTTTERGRVYAIIGFGLTIPTGLMPRNVPVEFKRRKSGTEMFFFGLRPEPVN